MKKRSLKENSVAILFILVRDFFVSLFLSFVLFIKIILGHKTPPLRENRFLDSLNFILHIGPKAFWKAPSGVKIGRSLATLLHYIFKKEEVFAEKKKGLGKGGFTLIEMLLSITIFSIIIIMAFDVMGNIGILRTRLSSKLDVNSELYTAVEKLTGLIKDGGDIDYEEYWNRSSVGTSTASGHYDVFSGYGNYGSGGNTIMNTYGDGLYFCLSGDSPAALMGTGGCLSTVHNTYSTSVSGQPQRFGQYVLQFVDYNANANYDSGGILGDEDGDGNIRGDDDDETIGIGPSAFTGGIGLKELYLIKRGIQTERIFFRWTLKPDPYAPSGATCNFVTGTGTGCLGNIQVLRLVGKDIGMDHSISTNDQGEYDGLIDTWECREDFKCNGSNNLPNGASGEWVDIFPDYINVKNIDFYPYPDKDFRMGWKEDDIESVINSYVRMNITLGLSWERRKKIKGPSGEVSITTTINLSK